VTGGAVGADQRPALLLDRHSDLVGGERPGDGRNRGGVALDGRLQRGCRHRPRTGIRQGGELEGGQRLTVGQFPGRVGRRRWNRGLTQPRQEPADPRRDRAVTGQRAPVRAGRLAQPQELREHLVGVGHTACQHRLGAGGGGDRVDQAVQGHGAYPIGEQVGVGLADQGPEGLPEVGELPVTDQLAQMVQVAGGVGGGDVGQQLAVQGAAALRQLDRLGQGNAARLGW